MGDNLSRIKLADKYKVRKTWLDGIPQRIKIQQQQARDGRREELEDLGKPPEPGYGLDGYPLQNWRGKNDAGNG